MTVDQDPELDSLIPLAVHSCMRTGISCLSCTDRVMRSRRGAALSAHGRARACLMDVVLELGMKGGRKGVTLAAVVMAVIYCSDNIGRENARDIFCPSRDDRASSVLAC